VKPANSDNRDIPLSKRLHLTIFFAQKNLFIKAVFNLFMKNLRAVLMLWFVNLLINKTTRSHAMFPGEIFFKRMMTQEATDSTN